MKSGFGLRATGYELRATGFEPAAARGAMVPANCTTA